MEMGGERKVKEKKSCKRSAGKWKQTSAAGEELGREGRVSGVASQKAAATEDRSADGKIFKEETVVRTERQKTKYTAVTSLGTQTGEGHVKEEVVEEKIWKKDEISYSWEARKDFGREMKRKAVGRDERSVDYDVTIKREVIEGEGTVRKIKVPRRPKAEESEINVPGHKTGKRKQRKAGRASKGPDVDGVKEEAIESEVSIQTSGFEGVEAARCCLEKEWAPCKGRTPVQEGGPREGAFTSKRCQLAEGGREAEGGDAKGRRPRQSQEKLPGAAVGGAHGQLLKRRRRCTERGQAEHGVAEEREEMHGSLSELPTSHAEVVFLSVKLGSQDEVVIDRVRRLALQKEIDQASC